MTDVRAGVDAIDQALVKLIAERQRYMTAAARIKPSRALVYDGARIEEIIAKVKANATACGLSETIAEPVWRILIDRSIAFEHDEWDRLHSSRKPRQLQCATHRTAACGGGGLSEEG